MADDAHSRITAPGRRILGWQNAARPKEEKDQEFSAIASATGSSTGAAVFMTGSAISGRAANRGAPARPKRNDVELFAFHWINVHPFNYLRKLQGRQKDIRFYFDLFKFKALESALEW